MEGKIEVGATAGGCGVVGRETEGEMGGVGGGLDALVIGVGRGDRGGEEKFGEGGFVKALVFVGDASEHIGVGSEHRSLGEEAFESGQGAGAVGDEMGGRGLGLEEEDRAVAVDVFEGVRAVLEEAVEDEAGSEAAGGGGSVGVEPVGFIESGVAGEGEDGAVRGDGGCPEFGGAGVGMDKAGVGEIEGGALDSRGEGEAMGSIREAALVAGTAIEKEVGHGEGQRVQKLGWPRRARNC